MIGTALEKFYFGVDLTGVGYPLKSRKHAESSIDATTSIPEEDTTATPETTTTNPRETIVFNKPFLFYLNDAKLGPLFYGIVETTQTMIEENPDENSKFSEETLQYLRWSCRSFKQSSREDN
jgi:hypothetical protein